MKKKKKEKCITCGDVGFYRDDFTGGESYCTCDAGKELQQKDEFLFQETNKKIKTCKFCKNEGSYPNFSEDRDVYCSCEIGQKLQLAELEKDPNTDFAKGFGKGFTKGWRAAMNKAAELVSEREGMYYNGRPMQPSGDAFAKMFRRMRVPTRIESKD